MSHHFEKQSDSSVVCSQCGKTEEFLSNQVGPDESLKPCRGAPGLATATAAPSSAAAAPALSAVGAPIGDSGAAPAVMQRRSSPPHLKEVYILGILSGVSNAPTLELLGTAFAVSHSKLLTAAHVLFDDDGAVNLLSGKLVIAMTVSKQGSGLIMQNPIHVVLQAHGLPLSDIAILELVDTQKPFGAFFPLCAEPELPELSKENEELKCYYAPIGQFLTNSFEDMSIWCGDYERVLQYDRSGSAIIVNGGLYRGSCGAPYVNHEGCAVALHISSMHEGRNVSLVKKRKRGDPAAPARASSIDDVIDSLTDISAVHESVREGLVLCKSTIFSLI